MHSFLVTSPPQIKPSPDVLEISPETSIGISEVRRIQSFLARKPLSSDKNTVIIHQAEKLTQPAQHALLKTLEEPPGNSDIYLITSYPDQLLPTILSRVQIALKTPSLQTDPKAFKSAGELLNRLLNAKGVGERLKILDDAGFTRDSAFQFLDQLEHLLHADLNLKINYKLLADTRRLLKANANLRLVLDNFAFRL